MIAHHLYETPSYTLSVVVDDFGNEVRISDAAFEGACFFYLTGYWAGRSVPGAA